MFFFEWKDCGGHKLLRFSHLGQSPVVVANFSDYATADPSSPITE